MSLDTCGSGYETIGRKKIEAFGETGGGLEDEEMDKSYKNFLTNLYEDSGLESSLDVSESDVDTSYGFENAADLEYKEYLKYFIAEGEACEFRILNDNGEFVQEIEHQPEITRNLQNGLRIKTRLATDDNKNLELVNKGIVNNSRKSLREAEDSRSTEIGPKSKGHDIKEGDGWDDNYRYYLKYLCKGSESCIEDDADPQYQAYIENLRAKEKSFEFEIPVYIAETKPEIEHHPNERNLQTSSKIKKRRDRENNEKEKETVKMGVKCDLRKSSRMNAQRKINIDEPEDSRNEEKCSKPIAESNYKKLEPKEWRGKNVNSAKRGKQDAKVDDNFVPDICYQEFLDNKHIEDDCMVYIYGRNRLKYEEDEEEEDDNESSSDIEIIKEEPIVQSGKTSQLYVSPIEGDDLQWIPDLVKDSKFRENLIEKLKRPYDQEEYDHLWNKVTEEKPKTFEKSTRFGVRKFMKVGFGKSYLELHEDLKAQLLSVTYERPKKLNILRGFFYWLENSSHCGAFIPWKDPSCLSVIPGSK